MSIKNIFIAPKNTNGRYDNHKYNSRRYKTLWRLTLILLIIFVCPPLISYIMTMTGLGTFQFILMSESAFVTLVTLVWGSYLASDYGTKRLGQYVEQQKPSEPPEVAVTQNQEETNY